MVFSEKMALFKKGLANGTYRITQEEVCTVNQGGKRGETETNFDGEGGEGRIISWIQPFSVYRRQVLYRSNGMNLPQHWSVRRGAGTYVREGTETVPTDLVAVGKMEARLSGTSPCS
jgi:hypothetical protein